MGFPQHDTPDLADPVSSTRLIMQPACGDVCQILAAFKFNESQKT